MCGINIINHCYWPSHCFADPNVTVIMIEIPVSTTWWDDVLHAIVSIAAKFVLVIWAVANCNPKGSNLNSYDQSHIESSVAFFSSKFSKILWETFFQFFHCFRHTSTSKWRTSKCLHWGWDWISTCRQRLKIQHQSTSTILWKHPTACHPFPGFSNSLVFYSSWRRPVLHQRLTWFANLTSLSLLLIEHTTLYTRRALLREFGGCSYRSSSSSTSTS